MTQIRVAFLSDLAPEVKKLVLKAAPSHMEVVFPASESEDDVLEAARDADVFITRAPRVTARTVAVAPRLKLVHKFGVGIDKIDLEAVWAAGAEIAITAGSNAVAVAEHAVGLMLAVNRRMPYLGRTMREGQWLRQQMRAECYLLQNKTVGLFGFGNIGRSLAICLRGFGVDILYYDPRRADAVTERALGVRYCEQDELIARADVLSLHLPALPSTVGMIGKAVFERMPANAILINTARGELIVDADLIAALDSGRLRGAGIDAFVSEPAPPDHPFLHHDRIVVTPHTAGGVIDNVFNVCEHIFRNIDAVLNGQPIAPEDRVRRPSA